MTQNKSYVWRFILKEYSPGLIYIQASKYTAAHVLSRLEILDIPNPVKNNIKYVNAYYVLEDEDVLHKNCTN